MTLEMIDKLSTAGESTLAQARAMADLLAQDYFGIQKKELWEYTLDFPRMAIYTDILFDLIIKAQQEVKEVLTMLEVEYNG